jgi:PTS system mannose-specific IIA component
MIGVVIAAHGDLAESLLRTAALVVRNTARVLAVSIRQEDDTQSYEARFCAAVQEVRGSSDGVLVLTDMFGGTPANIGMTLHEGSQVEVLTGVNLPMLIKVLQLMQRDINLGQIARAAKESGARSIAIASEVLAGVGPLTEKNT